MFPRETVAVSQSIKDLCIIFSGLSILLGMFKTVGYAPKQLNLFGSTYG